MTLDKDFEEMASPWLFPGPPVTSSDPSDFLLLPSWEVSPGLSPALLPSQGMPSPYVSATPTNATTHGHSPFLLPVTSDSLSVPPMDDLPSLVDLSTVQTMLTPEQTPTLGPVPTFTFTTADSTASTAALVGTTGTTMPLTPQALLTRSSRSTASSSTGAIRRSSTSSSLASVSTSNMNGSFIKSLSLASPSLSPSLGPISSGYTHKDAEKRRRDALNACLDDLKAVVPSLSQSHSSEVPQAAVTKVQVLQQTRAYILSLQDRVAALEKELSRSSL